MEIAEEEAEERELVRGARNDARGRPPVVQPGLARVLQVLDATGDVAKQDGEDDACHTDGDRRPARRAYPARRQVERGGEREQRGQGQREEEGQAEVETGNRVDTGGADGVGDQVVPVVVVVERSPGEPGIVRREPLGSVDRVYERHVHRLLRLPDVGRVAADERPAEEADREDQLACEPEAHRRRAERGSRGTRLKEWRKARQRPAKEDRGEETEADEHRHAPVAHEVHRGEEPSRIDGEQQSQRAAEGEPAARKAPEERASRGERKQADHLGEEPEKDGVGHRVTRSSVASRRPRAAIVSAARRCSTEPIPPSRSPSSCRFTTRRPRFRP